MLPPLAGACRAATVLIHDEMDDHHRAAAVNGDIAQPHLISDAPEFPAGHHASQPTAALARHAALRARRRVACSAFATSTARNSIRPALSRPAAASLPRCTHFRTAAVVTLQWRAAWAVVM